ncbi:hypothetical protein [Streptomyces sp. NRRL F-5630]
MQAPEHLHRLRNPLVISQLSRARTAKCLSKLSTVTSSSPDSAASQ